MMECKDPHKNCDDWECQKNGCQSDAKPRQSIEVGHLHDDKMMVVHEIVEHEDGSASVRLDIGKDAMAMLLEIGFVTILREGMKKMDAPQ